MTKKDFMARYVLVVEATRLARSSLVHPEYVVKNALELVADLEKKCPDFFDRSELPPLKDFSVGDIDAFVRGTVPPEAL